jgi:hypothetical protein
LKNTEKKIIRSTDKIECTICNSDLVTPRNFHELIVHYQNVHNFDVVTRAKAVPGGIIEVAVLERALD